MLNYIKSYFCNTIKPTVELYGNDIVVIRTITDVLYTEVQESIQKYKKVIVISESNIQNILEQLPNNIDKLIVKTTITNPEIINRFPSGVKYLYVCGAFYDHTFLKNLPTGLVSLTLDKGFDDADLLEYLPQSIKNLDLRETAFSGPLNNLPSNLKILTLGNRYKDVIQNLPLSIQELHVWGLYPKANISLMKQMYPTLKIEIYCQQIVYEKWSHPIEYENDDI